MADKRPWTPKEDSYLRANFADMTYAQLSKELGRGISSIYYRANKKLHLTSKSDTRLFSQQGYDIYITDNWNFKTVEDIANDLGVSQDYVYQRSRDLIHADIIKPKLVFYTKAEEDFIRLNWDDCSIEELAEMLNKSPHSVRSKGKRMGLRKKKK